MNHLTLRNFVLFVVLLAIGILLAVIFLHRPAKAQHNHDHHRFHAFYQNWINKDGTGCCNNRDCKTIADSDVQETSRGIFVRIEGELCPVLSKHYLARGKSPNWDSAHVCVQPKGVSILPQGPCERLLCYVPKPLF